MSVDTAIDKRRLLLRDPPDPAEYVDRTGTDLVGWLDAIEVWAGEIVDAWCGRYHGEDPEPMELRWADEMIHAVARIRCLHQRIVDSESARLMDVEELSLLSAHLMRNMMIPYAGMGRSAQRRQEKGGAKTSKLAKEEKQSRVDTVRKLHGKGLTHQQIADRMGANVRSVARYLSSSVLSVTLSRQVFSD